MGGLRCAGWLAWLRSMLLPHLSTAQPQLPSLTWGPPHSAPPHRRDGGIEGVLDHEAGVLQAARPADIYATDEPQVSRACGVARQAC